MGEWVWVFGFWVIWLSDLVGLIGLMICRAAIRRAPNPSTYTPTDQHTKPQHNKQVTRQRLSPTINTDDDGAAFHATPNGYLSITPLNPTLSRLEHCIVAAADAGPVRARVVVDLDAREKGPRAGVVAYLERRWADPASAEAEGENPFKGK